MRKGARPLQVPTEQQVQLSFASMAGLWTMRYGAFGCPDEETEGGILHIEGDRVAACGNYFLIHGRFDIRDGGLDVAVHAIRRRSGSRFDAIHDHPEPIFLLTFRVEAITADQFEGRFQQQGRPDMRVVMRRFHELGRDSRLV